MRKYGFKTFSSNLRSNPKIFDDIKEYVGAHKDRMFVEFMIVPGTLESELSVLKDKFFDIEVRIHAPHHLLGFDAGNKGLELSNRKMFELSQTAADILNAKTIVVHSGCGQGIGTIKETVRQFNLFDDERIVVENLPLGDDLKLSANTPDEVLYIKEHCGCGFCFDFSHALGAANYLGIDREEQLLGFYRLRPDVYHLCDGMIDETSDKHWHFGEGNYPLQHFVKDYTDGDAYITMETGQGAPKGIEPWIDDFEFMLEIEK
ncbi:MAG: hypothetical protein J6T72_01035 [Alphaproteobacteria bacterium]|nr:hypothetical protein [Alphaproteobacteria bacterium]